MKQGKSSYISNLTFSQHLPGSNTAPINRGRRSLQCMCGQ